MSTPGKHVLSIIIPTPGRVESLREVLAGLAACKSAEPYEVVVVDNASEPPIRAEVLATPGIPALRVLREMQRGKSYALNCAIDAGGLAEIVAVIDDDMAVPPDWIRGVLGSVQCLPQYDIFSGRSHVVWPAGAPRPGWANEPLAQGLLFSVLDVSPDRDVEFGIGCPRFPSGNHFWFRRALVDTGERFPHVWTNEAQFVIRMLDAGRRGVFVPEVTIGHRFQPELIDPRKFLERAHKIGREMAELDVSLGGPKSSLTARVRSSLRPVRAFFELCGWLALWCVSFLRPAAKRLPARAQAVWGIEYCKTRMNPALGRAAR